jgi:hypothetical protein
MGRDTLSRRRVRTDVNGERSDGKEILQKTNHCLREIALTRTSDLVT